MKKTFMLLAALLLSACQTAPQSNKFDSTLLSSSDIKLAVVIVKLPEPGYFKLGSQGLLDLAINHSLGKGIQSKISTIQPTAFVDVKSQIIGKLEQQNNIDIVEYPGKLELKLKVVSNENDKINSNEPYDYDASNNNQVDVSSVISETGADKVLVLQLVNFGASRHYYGFTPLGAPKGYAKIQAFLVNNDNSVEWQLAKYRGTDIDESVIGEWNQKPDYPNLLKSANKALNTAKEYLLVSIFEDVI